MSLKMAVVGYDVSKSLSPKMHTFILNKLNTECTYDKVSVPTDEFDARFPKLLKEYDTLNITIPYKLSCQKYLKEIREDALLFGAVNTIDARTSFGYNTDGMGFVLMLINEGVTIPGKKILVLGIGGAGRSIVKKLSSMKAEVSAYNRTYSKTEELYREYPHFTPLKTVENEPYDIIINATGIGMHETEGKSPVSEELIRMCDTAVDLIYVPEETEFLRLARINGKKTINGEAMLFYQAYYADCIFLGRKMDEKEALFLYQSYKNEK